MEDLAFTATEQYLLPAVELIGSAIVVFGVLSTLLCYVLFLFGSKEEVLLPRGASAELSALLAVGARDPSGSRHTGYVDPFVTKGAEGRSANSSNAYPRKLGR